MSRVGRPVGNSPRALTGPVPLISLTVWMGSDPWSRSPWVRCRIQQVVDSQFWHNPKTNPPLSIVVFAKIQIKAEGHGRWKGVKLRKRCSMTSSPLRPIALAPVSQTGEGPQIAAPGQLSTRPIDLFRIRIEGRAACVCRVQDMLRAGGRAA